MKLLFTYIPFQVLIGVLLGVLFPLINIYLIIIFTLVIFLLLGFYFFRKNYLFFCFVVFSGYVISCFSQYLNNNLQHSNNHYLSYVNKPSVISLTLIKSLKSSKQNFRFYARVNQVDSTESSGKILLQIPKIHLPKVGDVIMGYSTIFPINKASSNYNFNYQEYLKRRNIYGKIYLKNYSKINEVKSVFFEIQKLRSAVERKLLASNISFSTKSLMIAMLLGDKEYLTSEVENSFINSGVVHLIAISGMHIGVLYLLLCYSFSFLKYIKYGNYTEVFLILSCLVSFAIFSGLSSSVVRSVVMFGFILLSKLKREKGLLLEPIISSALLLLICNPNYLFNAGFQLSYLAVISIVVFYPIVTQKIVVKNKIVKYLVDVLIVSIIAQLGVLAISIYYFNQFSLQFLFANFFAVSLLPLVLYGGIIVLFKVLFWPSLSYVEKYYDIFINYFIGVLEYFSSLNKLLLVDINITTIQVYWYYLLLFFVWFCIKMKNMFSVFMCLSLIIICQISHVYERMDINNKTELIVYNTYKPLIISCKQRDMLQVFGTYNKEIIKKNKIRNSVSAVMCSEELVFEFDKNIYLIINKNLDYSSLYFNDGIIILDDNPKINLLRILIALKPNKVIISANNYISNVEKWKSTCKKLQVPFYDVKKQGAYIKSL